MGTLHSVFKADLVDIGIDKYSFRIDDSVNEWDFNTLSFLRNVSIHLLNNTVTHGYRGTQLTKAVVEIKAYEDKGNIFFEYKDFGKGIDYDRLADIATERHQSLCSTDKKELRDLMLQVGISTAKTVDMVAGRGIGVGAVHRMITEDLSGTMEIDDNPDGGFMAKISFPVPAEEKKEMNSRPIIKVAV